MSGGSGFPLAVGGLTVEEIRPDDGVVLADGFVILGDSKLSAALQDGGGAISDVAVLLRMPPVYVVSFADGDVRRYESRRRPPP